MLWLTQYSRFDAYHLGFCIWLKSAALPCIVRLNNSPGKCYIFHNIQNEPCRVEGNAHLQAPCLKTFAEAAIEQNCAL